jgi:hypothetical protein
LKHPKTGDKWIRPVTMIDGRPALAEPEFEKGRPLYAQHLIREAHPAESVYVCEGEWCADMLASMGCVATTSGSAQSAEASDWSPLAGRRVTIWPDNDEPGRAYAAAVKRALNGQASELRVVDIDVLNLPPKGDVCDWCATVTGDPRAAVRSVPTVAVAASEVDPGVAPEEEESESHAKGSQATRLVRLILETNDLICDDGKAVYAKERSAGRTRAIVSRQFRDWLTHAFFETENASPRAQAVNEAVATVSGIGRHRAAFEDVFLRVGQGPGVYLLDLGEADKARVVEIRPGKWLVRDDGSTASFIRSETMTALPLPVPGGDIGQLWKFANVPEESRLLVLAWLADCLRPDTPFPLLELIGEQGSAKSTTQQVLRRMIDPNACDLRGAPRGGEDVFVSATHNWIASYENVSHLSPAIQDALCILATGGGNARRALYTDNEEFVVHVKRPVLLNGIVPAITAQDLVDRTLSIDMPTVARRIETNDLWRDFERVHGQLLGALLDLFAEALKRLDTIEVPPAQQPRLIEFLRLGMAMAEAMGQPREHFLDAFTAGRQEAVARTIEDNAVAVAVLGWLEGHTDGMTASPKEWLERLDRPPGSAAWPGSPKGLADQFRRLAPALRQLGVEFVRHAKQGGVVRWTVRRR